MNDTSNVFFDLVAHRPTRVFRVDSHDRLAKADERVVNDLFKDGSFVVKIEVKGTSCDPRAGDYFVDFRGVVAAPGEHISCVRENLQASLGLIHSMKVSAGLAHNRKVWQLTVRQVGPKRLVCGEPERAAGVELAAGASNSAQGCSGFCSG